MRRSRVKIRRKRVIRRKKASLFRKVLFSVLGVLVFFLLTSLSFLQFSPNIQNIHLAGDSIDENSIKDIVKENSKISFSILGKEVSFDNIFIPNSKAIEKILKDFPQIDSVKLRKDYLKGDIYLELVEKQPYAVWCDDKCYLIDKNGTFIQYSFNDSDLIVIEQKQKEIDKKETIDCIETIKKLFTKYNLDIDKVAIYEDKLVISSSCDFIFNHKDDLDWQIEKLEAVLKQDKYSSQLNSLNYIDLRFENQAVVK